MHHGTHPQTAFAMATGWILAIRNLASGNVSVLLAANIAQKIKAHITLCHHRRACTRYRCAMQGISCTSQIVRNPAAIINQIQLSRS